MLSRNKFIQSHSWFVIMKYLPCRRPINFIHPTHFCPALTLRLHVASVSSPTHPPVRQPISYQPVAMGSHGESEAVHCDSTPPVSPTGHIFNIAEFSLCVHAICEFDQPIDVSHAKQAIRDILLPQNPRFSCIMVYLLIDFLILMEDLWMQTYRCWNFTMT